MTLFRGLGAFDDGTELAPGVGASPIDVRKDFAGIFAAEGGIGARAGVLPGGATPLVTGAASFAYNVGAFHAIGSRGASDGVQLFGNDGTALVGATGVGSTVPVAPGSGLQRIDIIWVRHQTNAENGDTSSAPLFGVASGAAVSSGPVAPVIPTGALELARNTMTSAATTTASGGNTIAQTVPYAAVRGTPILVRNSTERDALNGYASTANPITVERIDLGRQERNVGSGWILMTEQDIRWGAGAPAAKIANSVEVIAAVSFLSVPYNSRIFAAAEGIAGNHTGPVEVGLNIGGSHTVVQRASQPAPAATSGWAPVTRNGYMDVPAGVASAVYVTSQVTGGTAYFRASMILTRVSN